MALLSHADTEYWAKSRCDGCGVCPLMTISSIPHKLKRCQGCRVVWYCSRVCQSSRWSKHRNWCNILHGSIKIMNNAIVCSREWLQPHVIVKEHSYIVDIEPIKVFQTIVPLLETIARPLAGTAHPLLSHQYVYRLYMLLGEAYGRCRCFCACDVFAFICVCVGCVEMLGFQVDAIKCYEQVIAYSDCYWLRQTAAAFCNRKFDPPPTDDLPMILDQMPGESLALTVSFLHHLYCARTNRIVPASSHIHQIPFQNMDLSERTITGMCINSVVGFAAIRQTIFNLKQTRVDNDNNIPKVDAYVYLPFFLPRLLSFPELSVIKLLDQYLIWCEWYIDSGENRSPNADPLIYERHYQLLRAACYLVDSLSLSLPPRRLAHYYVTILYLFSKLNHDEAMSGRIVCQFLLSQRFRLHLFLKGRTPVSIRQKMLHLYQVPCAFRFSRRYISQAEFNAIVMNGLFYSLDELVVMQHLIQLAQSQIDSYLKAPQNRLHAAMAVWFIKKARSLPCLTTGDFAKQLMVLQHQIETLGKWGPLSKKIGAMSSVPLLQIQSTVCSGAILHFAFALSAFQSLDQCFGCHSSGRFYITIIICRICHAPLCSQCFSSHLISSCITHNQLVDEYSWDHDETPLLAKLIPPFLVEHPIHLD